MIAKIKYTVKYHPRPIKKVATTLFTFAGIVFLISGLILTPFDSLPPELKVFTMAYVLPQIFYDMNNVAILILVVGFGLWLFRWRPGRIELTKDKLTIDGSMHISICLRNMWEIDVRDMKWHRWRIRLDSKTDAVQIKFRTEREFEDFSEKLIKLAGQFENVKLKTTIYPI